MVPKIGAGGIFPQVSWAAEGVWEHFFQALIRDRSNEYLLIDSNIVRAHAQAATGKGGGGLGSGAFPRKSEYQVHLAVDGQGRPLRFVLTGGQRNDITQARALLAGFSPRSVLADKGYDSRELVELIRAKAQSQ